mmetsp:Transcript_32476/g.77118  ORF Transcript_32476/g.77118 Transcript_32476/m.77118 type:complete len:214 (-) Transcript_32476:35-676(-)
MSWITSFAAVTNCSGPVMISLRGSSSIPSSAFCRLILHLVSTSSCRMFSPPLPMSTPPCSRVTLMLTLNGMLATAVATTCAIISLALARAASVPFKSTLGFAPLSMLTLAPLSFWIRWIWAPCFPITCPTNASLMSTYSSSVGPAFTAPPSPSAAPPAASLKPRLSGARTTPGKLRRGATQSVDTRPAAAGTVRSEARSATARRACILAEDLR